MTQLAVWSIEGRSDGEAPQRPEPQRLGRSHIGLERHFEDWIVEDATLVAEGLTLVGRQIIIDDGRLDLLAIDSRDRWVVIEVKPGVLDSGALQQALYYASSLARLSADELYEKLEHGLNKLGDAERLSASVKRQLEGEEEEREIAVLLVGAGVHSGLERMNGFLGRFGVPISIVSFEVFELDGGPKLMVREVVDEPVNEPAPGRKLSEDMIRRRAIDAGVVEQFDRFVDMARKAGLAVQPQPVSVRIAPPANRTRFLMYARPQSGKSGGELHLSIGPAQFAEFFPDLDVEETAKVLGEWEGVPAGGEKLDELLNRIERFLEDKFPQPDADGG